MTLSPGDTIQIILTVGGVPYAKTHKIGDNSRHPVYAAANLMSALLSDIDIYANEGTEDEEESRPV